MSRLPFELSIPKPCTQDWSEMPGSAAVRHCAECNNEVHNLAALTPGQIERLIYESDGHVCARITRKTFNGEVVTASAGGSSLLRSALVFASTLSSSVVLAQDVQQQPAVVTGSILAPKRAPYTSPVASEVLFIQADRAVLTTVADSFGRFSATLPAGTYDVVFRSGILMGERVKNVTFHPGMQDFAPIQERFDYGHLAATDQSTEVYTTMGELTGTSLYRITPRNLLFHPIGVARTVAYRAKRLLHLSS
jgi:hypothetical protein